MEGRLEESRTYEVFLSLCLKHMAYNKLRLTTRIQSYYSAQSPWLSRKFEFLGLSICGQNISGVRQVMFPPLVKS